MTNLIISDSEFPIDDLFELMQENFRRLLWLVLKDDSSADQFIDISDFNHVPDYYDINDENLKNRLIELGFGFEVTKWLICPMDIDKELDIIASHGMVIVMKEKALQFIKLYIQSKICAAIMFHLCPAEYDKQFTNLATATLKKLFRRKFANGVLANPQTELDRHLSYAVDELEKRSPEDFDYRRFLTSYTSGDTDRYFLTQIFQCFRAPDLDRRDLYYVLAALFKLIRRNRNIMSESEFDNCGHYLYMTYRTYLARGFRIIDC